MKKIKSIYITTIFFSTLISLQSFAKEIPFNSNDSDILTTSCKEVMEIYQNREKENLFAAFQTSASEALRAGYCIGRIQQYMKQSHSCYYGHETNWFTMAKNIANLPLSSIKSSEYILQKAYCHEN